MKNERMIRKLNMIEMLVEELREEIDVESTYEGWLKERGPQPYDIRPAQFDSVENMPEAVREQLFNSLTTDIDHKRKIDWPTTEPEPVEPDHSTFPREAVPEPAKPAEVSVSEKRVAKTNIDWDDENHLLPRGTRFHSTLLRQQRAREQLTQDEVGAQAGLGGPTVSQLETGGTKRPHLYTVKKVADLMGVHPDLYVIKA